MSQWDEGTTSTVRPRNQWNSSITEIEEEELSEEWERGEEQGPMASIKEEKWEGRSSAASWDNDARPEQEECVYVGIGKSESSLDALLWTIYNSVSASTTLYLLHVFPETRFIPSPLGKLPKNQVSKEQLESFMAEESGKRREFLQKFIDTCTEAKVKVDTILLESDAVGKAISDLIPILHIRKLVLGASKSRKSKNKKSRIVDQIMQNGHDFCRIMIICGGKEVNWPTIEPASPKLPPTPSPHRNENASDAPRDAQEGQEDKRDNSFTCMCFNKPLFM